MRMDTLGTQDRKAPPLSALGRGVGLVLPLVVVVLKTVWGHRVVPSGVVCGREGIPTDYSCGYLRTALRWVLRHLGQCQLTILMKLTALGIQVRVLK